MCSFVSIEVLHVGAFAAVLVLAKLDHDVRLLESSDLSRAVLDLAGRNLDATGERVQWIDLDGRAHCDGYALCLCRCLQLRGVQLAVWGRAAMQFAGAVARMRSAPARWPTAAFTIATTGAT